MLSRRAFILNSAALAAASPGMGRAEEPAPTILKLQRRTIEVNGRAAEIYSIRQPDGTPGLVTQVDSRFRVRVVNELAEPSLVHWHGLTPPWRQDGVPGITGPAISPGGSQDYDFPLDAGGTYFMHSHYGFQEQGPMAAPLIVRDPKRYPDWQEAVVLLTDFSFRPPQEIYASLVGKKRAAAGMAMKGMEGSHSMHMGGGMSSMHTGMAMAGPDLNDVTYDAFLANERTLADPQIIGVENGGRVLLRVANASAMSNFWVNLGELGGRLVAVDGQDILPISGSLFPIAVGQRLDILVELPKGSAAFPVLFVLEGETKQTGVILAPPGARVGRVQDDADKAAAALNLGLEGQLRGVAPLKPRKADRALSLDLTGDMASYVWSLNNVVWTEETPAIEIASGERVELAMTNRTMMSHPMHLHGHRYQVVEIDGVRVEGALRDTVLVPPGKRVVVAFDANNPGRWAFHCHLLYHAHAGMFATFHYS